MLILTTPPTMITLIDVREVTEARLFTMVNMSSSWVTEAWFWLRVLEFWDWTTAGAVGVVGAVSWEKQPEIQLTENLIVKALNQIINRLKKNFQNIKLIAPKQ